MNDDLSVFDDPPEEREPTGECRRCKKSLYHPIGVEQDDDLCFGCWVRLDKAEAEYRNILWQRAVRGW